MSYQVKIHEILDWCKNAYSNQGYKLQLPRCSDVTKTYQWRYVTALSKQIDSLGLDESTSQRFIEEVACYAKERNLLHKGLSILMQSNILKEVYVRLSLKDQQNNAIIDVIKANHAFITANQELLKRSHPDDYRNIVRWYLSKKISEQYLAISRKCTKALNKLAAIDQEERLLLPSSSNLVVTRMRLRPHTDQLKSILNEDWRPINVSTCT